MTDNVQDQATQRRFETRVYAMLSAALLVCLIFQVNYISFRHYARWDATAHSIYTLSDRSRAVVDELDTNVAIWILLSEAEPGFTSFLDPDGRSGYLYAEPLEAFAEHSEAVRASFLDPGTPLGRAVEVERLSGHAIVDALSTHVERLDVVALHSAPTYDGSVLAIHVLGGRDALTGELVGVVLERVWT